MKTYKLIETGDNQEEEVCRVVSVGDFDAITAVENMHEYLMKEWTTLRYYDAEEE